MAEAQNSKIRIFCRFSPPQADLPFPARGFWASRISVAGTTKNSADPWELKQF